MIMNLTSFADTTYVTNGDIPFDCTTDTDYYYGLLAVCT